MSYTSNQSNVDLVVIKFKKLFVLYSRNICSSCRGRIFITLLIVSQVNRVGYTSTASNVYFRCNSLNVDVSSLLYWYTNIEDAVKQLKT